MPPFSFRVEKRPAVMRLFHRTGNLCVTPATVAAHLVSTHDPRAARAEGGAVAASLSLWSNSLRAGLRERRDARCHRMETGLPLRAG